MDGAFAAIRDFYPDAETLRRLVDRHFAEPYAHKPETHQVWNYWYVPEHYAYMRTDPSKVMGRAAAQAFYDHLKTQAFERWGLTGVTWPYLSCYVAGCHQALHNDAKGGRLGFVYSLTRWEQRKFSGGETLIFREGDYFGSARMTEAQGARNFYDLVPSLFNQLLVFDDRVPHAVPRLEGGMDPAEGRIVMHGHLSEGAPEVEGALASPEHVPTLQAHVTHVVRRIVEEAAGRYHGLCVLRVHVEGSGAVTAGIVLFNRVMALGPQHPQFDAQQALIMLGETRFPVTGDASRLTVPVVITPV